MRPAVVLPSTQQDPYILHRHVSRAALSPLEADYKVMTLPSLAAMLLGRSTLGIHIVQVA